MMPGGYTGWAGRAVARLAVLALRTKYYFTLIPSVVSPQHGGVV